MKTRTPWLALLAGGIALAASAQEATITIQAGAPGKAISPNLFGIFFEDINYAADGGLYAELVQNRSFEYQTVEQRTWDNLTSWELVTRGGGKGSVAVDASFPLHPNNPHYAVVSVDNPGGGVGLSNPGFDGMAVREGEQYELALFARQLFIGPRWGGAGKPGALPMVAQLESADGSVLGSAALEVSIRDWRRVTATITAAKTDPAARLVLLVKGRGGLALDEISLFPKNTLRNRPNGLRADLAQVIADLKPKFIRFPGGCLAHGNGLGNMYRWKDTIGPIEQRRQQPNVWGYHQTAGLGYFEYFQFCEDIGARPLPVVPAGVCCQNSGHGIGQAGIPLDQMPAYVQEVLDLVEWANGPATSAWGAKRAAAGHPEPFHLKYIGVGNEDQITPVFKERFRMIFEAMQQKHPEITVIGTVGPFHSGEDFEAGWRIANELRVPMVDEHYYEKPEWFLGNLSRYDSYDRAKSKVYLGEYASRGNTLFNALAEAAYMTCLERNGDVVELASYAPLLAKQGHTQWNPDLIYFNNTNIMLTANYYVQRLFGQNGGDTFLAADVSPATSGLSVSCVKDSGSGDMVLKMVNVSSNSVQAHIKLDGFGQGAASASRTVLSGQPGAVNSFARPRTVAPQTDTLTAGKSFDCEAPAHSLTVIRMPGR